MAANISDRYIVDASFVISYLFPDEHPQHETDTLFDRFNKRDIDFYAPYVLSFEVVNALRSSFLRKRYTINEVAILTKNFINLEITELPVDYEEVLQLSLAKQLSVYDASYVWLAKKEHAPLLTLDRKLTKI